MCISEEELINSSFCMRCVKNRHCDHVFCGLYQYLVDDTNYKINNIEDYCDKQCDNCNCEITFVGCPLKNFEPYIIFHVRDVIVHRRLSHKLNAERNGVKEYDL